jgi:divalent metal cation (Fe/Co/Zn/Cd) transporter
MQLVVSLAALAAGVVLALAGAAVVVLGIQGSLDWSFEAFGVKSKLIDASPGVVLMVVAVLTIVLNRFSLTAERSTGRKRRSDARDSE